MAYGKFAAARDFVLGILDLIFHKSSNYMHVKQFAVQTVGIALQSGNRALKNKRSWLLG